MTSVPFTDSISFELHGFTAIDIPRAAHFAADQLFPSRKFPPLRSNVIRVVCDDSRAPFYAIDSPIELISLNCAPNAPWQFTYQFSHELGHLTARNQLRFKKPGEHRWIEEVLCGAYSVYVLHQMSKLGPPLGPNAQKYLDDHITEDYSADGVDHAWFVEESANILLAKCLTKSIMKISGLVADRFLSGEFISDNVALGETPPNENVLAYLDDWKARCGRTASVPQLLQTLTAAAR